MKSKSTIYISDGRPLVQPKHTLSTIILRFINHHCKLLYCSIKVSNQIIVINVAVLNCTNYKSKNLTAVYSLRVSDQNVVVSIPSQQYFAKRLTTLVLNVVLCLTSTALLSEVRFKCEQLYPLLIEYNLLNLYWRIKAIQL